MYLFVLFVHHGDVSMLCLMLLHNKIQLPQKKKMQLPECSVQVFYHLLMRQTEAGDKIHFSQCPYASRSLMTTIYIYFKNIWCMLPLLLYCKCPFF